MAARWMLTMLLFTAVNTGCQTLTHPEDPVKVGEQAVPPERARGSPPSLLLLLGEGAAKLLHLAEETSRAAMQAAMQSDEAHLPKGAAPNRTQGAPDDGGLTKVLAASTAAAGAVASMSGWDRAQLGMWLAQTGLDSYHYQMGIWKFMGAGSPY